MDELLPEEEVYRIVEEALRTEGVDVLRLAALARSLNLSCIGKKAKELANEGRLLTDEEWGKAFWELLKEAIDRLRPLGSLPRSVTPEWRTYVILYREYVLGTPNRRIAIDLDLRRREFLRRRRTTIRRVVRQIVQWG